MPRAPAPPLLLAASLLAASLAAGPARADTATPVVVELFTSQGCSSCPPADALLGRLAASGRNLLVLDMHVTYWDRLGWRDPFSLEAATQRQRRYAALLGTGQVYTPQLVAGGTHQAVGSESRAVADAIAAAAAAVARAAPVSLRLRPQHRVTVDPGSAGGTLAAEVGAGRGSATLWLVGFDPRHLTRVGRGENAGRMLEEVNVVRSLQSVATWTGAPLAVAVPTPVGERAALLLQDESGRILAATEGAAGVSAEPGVP